MTGTLRPVLSVPDPNAALAWFGALPGVTIDWDRGEAHCGDLRIAVLGPDYSDGPDFRRVAIDHLALRVGDVDRMLGRILESGGQLDTDFTPDGPKEIDEFWGTGVRFAFVTGPGGVPLEICRPRNGISETDGVTGLDHIGLRTTDTGETSAQLISAGAFEIARYDLKATRPPVAVRFLREGNLTWEVFDEPRPDAQSERRPAGAWKGILLDRQT
jgi:catechol 2,3-dioxygenase-like lactoylglutathione lyase family enzyme